MRVEEGCSAEVGAVWHPCLTRGVQPTLEQAGCHPDRWTEGVAKTPGSYAASVFAEGLIVSQQCLNDCLS